MNKEATSYSVYDNTKLLLIQYTGFLRNNKHQNSQETWTQKYYSLYNVDFVVETKTQ